MGKRIFSIGIALILSFNYFSFAAEIDPNDVQDAGIVNFYLIRGEKAQEAINRLEGSNVCFLFKEALLFFFDPAQPVGQQKFVEPWGKFRLNIVSGKTAEALYKEWGSNETLKVDKKIRLIVILDLKRVEV